MLNIENRYEIRLAQKNDISAIMAFIRDYWDKNHIIANNRSFFEYEFLEDDGSVNFIVAIDKNKGTIECLNGFLRSSHTEGYSDIWGSFLKTKEGNMPFLGVELLRQRKELTRCREELGIGDNPKTSVVIFDKIFHRFTAKMNHYYRLADCSEYKIAKVPYQRCVNFLQDNEHIEITRIYNINDLKFNFANRDVIPYKDEWYIYHRFLQHPIFDYRVYSVSNNKYSAIIVLRDQWYSNRLAVRIVDFLGDDNLLSSLGSFFDKELKREGCEYIDFYCWGFNDTYLKEAGFSKLEDNSDVIIPNYFEPFVQANVDIWIVARDENVRFCKADGDQDNPKLFQQK